MGAAGVEDTNSYHVVIGKGVDVTTILDGVTITSGSASGDSALPKMVAGCTTNIALTLTNHIQW